MITDKLQSLIISGKAIYNTITIGGGQKFVLNVKKNRFIIIHNIVYMGASKLNILGNDFNKLTDLENLGNTQLKIFSNKSKNQFMFRDFYDISSITNLAGEITYAVTPKGVTNIDTYLIHESDISFTFSNCGKSASVINANSPADSPAQPQPNDYGSDGQIGITTPTRQVSTSVLGLVKKQTLIGGSAFIQGGGNTEELQFTFPVDSTTDYVNLDNPGSYPIVNIQYVEVKGIPANLSGTF